MSLDQFYTKPEIAQLCFNKLKEHIQIDEFDHIVEPSAGEGSFFKLLNSNKRIGIDLEPKCDNVVKMNYMDFIANKNKSYLIVGNPPFGKNSSSAIKFFNKSAEYCMCIAFILPRTFKRVSIQNQLDLNFHLQYNYDLPLKPCCFYPNMNAKCSFQIWIRKDEKRIPVVYDKVHKDFSFLKLGPKDINNQPTPPNNADFAVKAYGSNCGNIVSTNLDKLRPKSWHWIKANIDIDLLKKRFSELDYSISKDTVRQDSIGQQELIHLYKNKHYKN